MNLANDVQKLIDIIGAENIPAELGLSIKKNFDALTEVWIVADEHLQDVLAHWEATEDPDARFTDEEESAYIDGALMMGEERSLPSRYISQGAAP